MASTAKLDPLEHRADQPILRSLLQARYANMVPAGARHASSTQILCVRPAERAWEDENEQMPHTYSPNWWCFPQPFTPSSICVLRRLELSFGLVTCLHKWTLNTRRCVAARSFVLSCRVFYVKELRGTLGSPIQQASLARPKGGAYVAWS